MKAKYIRKNYVPYTCCTLFFTVVLIRVLHKYQSQELEALKFGFTENTKRKCIIYDKPERSGSTTAAEALHKCVLYKGYKSLFIPNEEYHKQDEWENRKRAFKLFLDQPGDRIAIVRRHVHISKLDLAALYSRCDSTFLVTSAAPMKHRILSRIKYDRDKGYLEGSFSTSIRSIIAKDGYENFLTRYPYVEDQVPENERLIPDYVIRKEKFNEDLSVLLGAFGCASINIETENNHKLDSNTTNLLLETIERYLKTSDFRFKTDTEIGRQRNKKSIEPLNYFENLSPRKKT